MKRPRLQRILAFFVCVFTMIAIVYFRSGRQRNCQLTSEFQPDPGQTQTSTAPPAVILLWTTFFGSGSWDLPELGRRPFQDRKCPYSNCVVTNEKSCLTAANFLLFHCRESFRIWPEDRHPEQIYAAYCWENPSYANFSIFRNHRMNMTITYRLDSDLVDRAGEFRAKKQPSLEAYIPRVPFSQKSKSVVWLVSNCNASSQRHRYVEELSKHIDVDIYGGCGKHTCPQAKTSECFTMFEGKYKFYLSFENSICKDYTTEKFYRTLQYELVPIVLGGGDYGQVAPPHSYINVKDYKSPRALVEYLHYLSGNQEEYQKYFQWKQTNESAGHDLWCELCKAVTHRSSYHRDIDPSDLEDWWRQGTCDNNLVGRLLDNI